MAYENSRRSIPERLFLLSLTDTRLFSLKILSLSEIFIPKAKTIFRFVSILHGSPRSIRVMVRGEMLASLESSALLIIRDSLISFRLFLLIFKILYYLFNIIIMSLFTFVLQKLCKNQLIFILAVISICFTDCATDQQFEPIANYLIL
jgi:hypothetical protein